MSGMTAARLTLFDRGLLRPGMKAHIVIFDPDTVADKAEFNKPRQYAVGFRDVIVTGKPVIANGQLTNERPGRVLYGPAKRWLRLPPPDCSSSRRVIPNAVSSRASAPVESSRFERDHKWFR